MSGSRLLRLRVNERLEAAVEEIFGLVEKTIAVYEEGAVRSKREIGQLKQQLEQLVVLKPQVILNRADTRTIFEARPPSLHQYEFRVEEIPVPEEAKIREHPGVKEHPGVREETVVKEDPGVKEESVERRLSLDMEVDTCNKAEVKTEINLLLKAEATSFTADTQEISSWQQPDCLVPVEEMKTCDAQQIKEEQEEKSISPDVGADALNVDPDSEPAEYCEPLSSSTTETESLNKSITDDDDDDDERTEMCRSSSPPQNRSAELQQPPGGDRSCRFCGNQFSKDSFLIKHVAEHHKGHLAFKCLQCKREFQQRYRMVMHTRIHTGEKRASPLTSSDMQKGSQIAPEKVNVEEEEPLKCFELATRSLLKSSGSITPVPSSTTETVSLNESAGERTEMCRSSSPRLLQQPPRGDRSCRLCGRTFRLDSFLIKHVAERHKGHLAFKCLQCKREFEQRYRMVIHTRVHLGGKFL